MESSAEQWKGRLLVQFDDTCICKVTLSHHTADAHECVANLGMAELLRTNDLVLISAVRALLAEQNIHVLVLDEHMSALEGSLGFLPRRVFVTDEDFAEARLLLVEAGLGRELPGG